MKQILVLAIALAVLSCSVSVHAKPRDLTSPLPSRYLNKHSPLMFGEYNNRVRAWHLGLDLMAPAGTPVYAVCPGTIVEKRYDPNYWNSRIMVVHPASHCNLARDIIVIYGHVKTHLRVGAKLSHGETIGVIQQAWRPSNSHIHLGVRPAVAGLVTHSYGYTRTKSSQGFVNPILIFKFPIVKDR